MTRTEPGTTREHAADERLAALRAELLDVVRERAYRRLPEPVRLASGQMSRDFVDAKRGLARGPDLALACETILAVVDAHGVEFDAVGGLTLGADQFAHGVAIVGGRSWFVVRKERKGRGTDQRVEGAEIHGVGVLLVDDVVSTGGSIRQAREVVTAAGADVRFATTLVDRGESARRFFDEVGVPYEPVLTYEDLGIEPIGP